MNQQGGAPNTIPAFGERIRGRQWTAGDQQLLPASAAASVAPFHLPPMSGSSRQASSPSSIVSWAAPSSKRRGCNCKKSGCLKLYCECFAANVRCGDRCQCVGCKNKEHNRLEIAHAIQAIEKRTQKSFRSAATAAKKLEQFRNTAVDNTTHTSQPGGARSQAPGSSGVSLLPVAPAEKAHTSRGGSQNAATAASSTANQTLQEPCSCKGGVCTTQCSCLSRSGTCSAECLCKGCQPLHVGLLSRAYVSGGGDFISSTALVSLVWRFDDLVNEQQHGRTKGCSCKKSNCLKLYCECLAAQRVCDSRCNCEGCKNKPDHQHERDRAITAILERNPLAFQPKVADGTSQHLRGCNCRKSGCMKNYCECHQAGVPCTSRCACHQCRNTEMFASAKKMLMFMAPDDSMDGKHGSEEATQRATKRAYRKPSLDAAGPPPRAGYAPFRSQQSSSALEILSRSAPPASAPYPLAIGSLQVHIPAKRLQADPPYYTAGRPAEPITTTFPKRKYSKVSNACTSFSDRLEAATTTESPLPPIEAMLETEFSSVDDAEPSLSKLCRSLLHAAMAVDSKTGTASHDHGRVEEQPLTVSDRSQVGGSKEPNTPRGHLSPHTEDLLCVEDIETSGEKPVATSSLSQEEAPPSDSNRDSTRQNATSARKIAAAQERAVLQEVSVWLRNMTTASLPNGNSASPHA